MVIVNISINKQKLFDGMLQLQLNEYINIDEDKLDKLIRYAELLMKWNKVYSLTALDSADDILSYHLLDGLSLVPYIKNNISTNTSTQAIIDIGSGMGVPGVILAIMYPDKNISVLDSNNKKTTFLRMLSIELSLKNLYVIESRLESYMVNTKYDIIISRAFANLSDFVLNSMHLIHEQSYFLSMKGEKVVQELELLKTNFTDGLSKIIQQYNFLAEKNLDYKIFNINLPYVNVNSNRCIIKIQFIKPLI